MRSCIILGGGIGGLTLADRLSLAGVRVTVLEREKVLGGLARGVLIDGSRVDWGPHNVRAKTPEVLAYYRELIGEALEPRRFRATLYFRGRPLRYPINPFQLMTALPPERLMRYVIGFLGARAKGLWDSRPPDSYESWAVRQYGRPLYRAFFGPLTEKTWGVKPERLDVRLARERLPPFSLRSILLGRAGTHREDPEANRHYYPRFGVAQFVESLESRLRSRGVRLLTAAPATGLHLSGARARVEWDGGAEEADTVASTIPLDALGRLLPELEGERLRYRGAGFAFLSLTEGTALGESIRYVADSALPFHRITDFSQFSRGCLAPGRNVWCVEFSGEGDPVAGGERAVEALGALGWLDRDRILAAAYHRLETVYPLYERGHRERLAATFERAARIPRLWLAGRQGLFVHGNLDDVMGGAFRAAERMTSGCGDGEAKLRYYRDTSL